MFERSRRGRGGSEVGQTPTELLMILGIITAVAIVVLSWMHVSLRAELQTMVNCIVNDYDRCMK